MWGPAGFSPSEAIISGMESILPSAAMESRESRMVAAALAAFVLFTLARLTARRLRKAWRRSRLSKSLACAPGALPFFGHAIALATQCPWELCESWAAKMGPFFRFKLFASDWVVVSDPVLLKEVLRERLSDFEKDRGYSLKHILCVLGTGMVSSDGPHWRSQRLRMSKALRAEVVERVPEMAVAATERLTKKLRDAEKEGVNVLMCEEFRHLTLQVIAEALMGISPEESDAIFAKMYLPIVTEANARVWNPARTWAFFLPGWWAHRRNIRNLDTYVSGLVLDAWSKWCEEAKWEEESNGGERTEVKAPLAEKEVLRRIMEGAQDSGPALDKRDLQQMRDEIKTFVLAGHETSAAMLTWTLFELMQSEEVLRRATEEADAVWGSLREGDAADHTKLAYTEACLRESLRKYSVVPTVTRVAARDAPLGGVTIPKGTRLMLLYSGVHNREDIWPEPQKYDPERFMNKEWTPYSFVAFSEGPRVCLGQNLSLVESKIVLSLLLHRFNFELGESLEACARKDPWMIPVVPLNGTPIKVRSKIAVRNQ